jgi:hypothetical protein
MDLRLRVFGQGLGGFWLGDYVVDGVKGQK